MHTEATTIHSFPGPRQSQYAFEALVGEGSIFQDLMEQARLVARADCRVLLIGEQGSGKETLARTIHSCSDRHRYPFHKINCSDFHPVSSQHPLQLWNQEGNALSLREGDSFYEQMQGGTVYLHEVETLTAEAQSWLLRFLLAMEMETMNRPHCGKDEQVRIIAGTSRNLEDDVAAQRFRAALYYRLNVVPLHIPPLRHRVEDIEALAYHFVNIYSGKYGKTIDRISDQTLAMLRSHRWPGNIEELGSLLERSIILSKSRTLYIDRAVQEATNFPAHS